MLQEYYQIYHNHHALNSYNYTNLKDARRGLNELYENITSTSLILGYKVKQRSLMPRNILGLRFIYSDGTEVNQTYLILHVRLQPVLSKI